MESSLMRVDDKFTEDSDANEFDSYLDEIGALSRFQLVLVACGTLVMFSGFTVTTLPVFLSATPEFSCAKGISGFTGNNRTEIEALVNTHQVAGDVKCSHVDLNCTSNCLDDTTNISAPSVIISQNCDNYTYDRRVYTETITSEWNLVCGDRMLKALANSFMFLGFFIGSLTAGVLGDRLGRRLGMMIMAITTGVFGVATALSPNYVSYLICFTIMSGGSIGELLVGFTYVSEISNRKQRDDIMMVTTLLAALGDILISPVASIFRHWRYIAGFVGAVALLCVPVCYFMSESPRWLLSTGKENRARNIVEKYFLSKKIIFSDERWAKVLKAERVKRLEGENSRKRSSGFSDLFKYPNIRLLTLNVMSCWFIVSMVYYGLILNIGNLSGDPYVNGVINSTLDVIASTCLLLLLRISPKTRVISGSFFLAGVGCIGSMLVLQSGHAAASVILACIGRFGAACAYKVAYMLTAEVYPTVLRSSGMSLGSGASRIGGMISPFAVEAQETSPWIMQTLFGSLSFVACILALAFPNTRRIGLMSFVEEVEEFCAENLPAVCRRKSESGGRRFTSASLRKSNSLMIQEPGVGLDE